jgi:NAD(P) transhydrogenase subunit alpha
MPVQENQLYAKNISTFVTYMMKEGEHNLDLEDEIISGAMITHEGKITHEPTRESMDNS